MTSPDFSWPNTIEQIVADIDGAEIVASNSEGTHGSTTIRIESGHHVWVNWSTCGVILDRFDLDKPQVMRDSASPTALRVALRKLCG